MFADGNLVNRRNLSAGTKHSYAQNKQMFMLAMEARVAAAVMTILGIEDINGKPTKLEYKFHVTDAADKHLKKKYLRDLASSIVDKFILDNMLIRQGRMQRVSSVSADTVRFLRYSIWLYHCIYLQRLTSVLYSIKHS